MIREEIKELIKESIIKLQKQKEIPVFDIDEIKVEHSEQKIYGDYSANIAMIIAKKVKKNPIETAELLIENFKDKIPDLFERIKIVKPGFINFFVSNKYLQEQIKKIIKEKSKYVLNQTGKGKTIIVEYAHPNTHKIFHVGHLRNITNGEAIVRILETNGYKVIRANYQGDVGLHIAKCLWAMKKTTDLEKKIKGLENLDEKIEFLSKCYVDGTKAYEKDGREKKEISEINKQIYNKDSRIKDLWKETRKWSLDYFEKIYKRVYTHFDRYYFESEVAEKGKDIVLKFKDANIFIDSRGAIIFPGSKYGLHDRVFVTKEGNPTYEAKDMELGRLQFKEYRPDLIIHNVGPEQKEYFQVIFKALSQAFPYTENKERHLISGWVSLREGKMSSRKGVVIVGKWLIDEVKKRIKKSFKKVSNEAAEKIAVGAVKYSFLKNNPSTDIVFDINESISLQGNSGPYLQYSCVRANSVLTKSKENFKKIKNLELKEEQEISLARILIMFPEFVKEAGRRYAPNLIANYLFELAQNFNSFYESLPILKAENESIKRTRLALVFVFSQVLKDGLSLLGILTPEKM